MVHVSGDYIGSKGASMRLARNIEEYYHRQGYKNVKCRVEPFYTTENPEKSAMAGVRPLFCVRSNITFTVPE